MEKKINNKVERYIEGYREAMRREILGLEIESVIQNKILETLYSFETLHLEKEDFMKRKRIVSQVAMGDRCIAKKANGDQCSRKKKETCNFCGTHEKCQPHGVISITNNDKTMKRCCITIMDINGINYYVDDNNNVYNTADILSNSSNPNIIGRLSQIDGKIELHII